MSATRCNCEASYCPHEAEGKPCATPADGAHVMDYVGHVCAPCAQLVIAHGGAQFIRLAEEATYA